MKTNSFDAYPKKINCFGILAIGIKESYNSLGAHGNC